MAVWEKEQKVIDDKEEVLDDFMEQQSDLYSQMLAQKTSKYLVAAWQVTGEPKKKVDGSGGGSKSGSRDAGALDQVPGQATQALFLSA